MDVFETLADPVRRNLLRALVAGPARVVDLTSAQAISRPAVSRHLRMLSQAGLVHGKDHGRERHYSLDTRPLAEVQDLLIALQSPSGQVLATPSTLDALETEVHRASRDRRETNRTSTTTPAHQEDIA